MEDSIWGKLTHSWNRQGEGNKCGLAGVKGSYATPFVQVCFCSLGDCR